jgi:hypothetical protein
MSDRRLQFRRVLATYRGLGVTDKDIAEVVRSLSGERALTEHDLETALRQYTPVGALDQDTPSGRLRRLGELLLAGPMNERKRRGRHPAAF